MPKGRNVSGEQAIQALMRMGCERTRQGKGDHVIMSRQTANGRLTSPVPMHKPIKIGTLKGILKELQLDFDEFMEKVL